MKKLGIVAALLAIVFPELSPFASRSAQVKGVVLDHQRLLRPVRPEKEVPDPSPSEGEVARGSPPPPVSMWVHRSPERPWWVFDTGNNACDPVPLPTWPVARRTGWRGNCDGPQARSQKA